MFATRRVTAEIFSTVNYASKKYESTSQPCHIQMARAIFSSCTATSDRISDSTVMRMCFIAAPFGRASHSCCFSGPDLDVFRRRRLKKISSLAAGFFLATDSASYMQDSVGLCWFLLQYIDGLLGRENKQLNLSTPCFEPHFLHDRQSTTTRADHQPPALPRYFLLDGQWCMAKKIAESFGSLLLAFAYLAAVDHHVMLIANSIDSNQAKGKPFEVHMCLYAYDNGATGQGVETKLSWRSISRARGGAAETLTSSLVAIEPTLPAFLKQRSHGARGHSTSAW